MAAYDDEHLYSLPYENVPSHDISYNELTDKPSINGVEIEGTKSSEDYGIIMPDVPTKTSDLINDSGFITSAAVPTKTSQLQNDNGFITATALPTKTSELTNDSDFITSAALPTKTSDLTNDSDFVNSTQVQNMLPTKTSELTNDSGFITSSAVLTKTSELTNDSGFVTSSDVPTALSQLANDVGYITISSVPYATSQLTNDSGFITSAAIPTVPTKTSQLTNDSGFITTAALPTKTSDLTNDSHFTTKNYVDTQDNALSTDINNINLLLNGGGTLEHITTPSTAASACDLRKIRIGYTFLLCGTFTANATSGLIAHFNIDKTINWGMAVARDMTNGNIIHLTVKASGDIVAGNEVMTSGHSYSFNYAAIAYSTT